MLLTNAVWHFSRGMAYAAMGQTDKSELLRHAVELEDSLAYDEPPAWFMPVRELLGDTLTLEALKR